MIPIFCLLETPPELKINLSCTLSCTALNCGTVMNITWQLCIVLSYTILYNTVL